MVVCSLAGIPKYRKLEQEYILRRQLSCGKNMQSRNKILCLKKVSAELYRLSIGYEKGGKLLRLPHFNKSVSTYYMFCRIIENS